MHPILKSAILMAHEEMEAVNKARASLPRPRANVPIVGPDAIADRRGLESERAWGRHWASKK